MFSFLCSPKIINFSIEDRTFVQSSKNCKKYELIDSYSAASAITLLLERESLLLAVAFFAPLRSGLGMFPKISLERIQVRFCTGYVEVGTEDFEPHLNHAPYNSLIINEFIIPHRQIASTSNHC